MEVKVKKNFKRVDEENIFERIEMVNAETSSR